MVFLWSLPHPALIDWSTKVHSLGRRSDGSRRLSSWNWVIKQIFLVTLPPLTPPHSVPYHFSFQNQESPSLPLPQSHVLRTLDLFTSSFHLSFLTCPGDPGPRFTVVHTYLPIESPSSLCPQSCHGPRPVCTVGYMSNLWDTEFPPTVISGFKI